MILSDRSNSELVVSTFHESYYSYSTKLYWTTRISMPVQLSVKTGYDQLRFTWKSDSFPFPRKLNVCRLQLQVKKYSDKPRGGPKLEIELVQ